MGLLAHQKERFAYEQEVMAWGRAAQDPRPQMAAWLGSLPPDQFPNTVALASVLVAGDFDDRFEWGMDVIIRGLASFLDKPPDPRAHWPVPPGTTSRR